MDYQINCPHCGARLGIMAVQVASSLRCPHCQNLFVVGDPTGSSQSQVTGALFSFACDLCRSHLEAYTGMIGKTGLCPTCGAEFVIPPPNQTAQRTGGTMTETEYAQPVHAFAAAGDKAPAIAKLADGRRAIRCPRCGRLNEVQSNNCAQCAAPFTLEGADRPTGTRMPLASLVMGIVGIPTAPALIPSVLAIIFGLMGLKEPKDRAKTGTGQAIAGLVLGAIGILIAVLFYTAL